jgi:putative ABC transport system permease protein
MIKNFFKVAWRNLLRNKGFSFINISGLSIGMAAAILIILWLQGEIIHDQFPEEKPRIYEAWNKATVNHQPIMAAIANPVKSLRTE